MCNAVVSLKEMSAAVEHDAVLSNKQTVALMLSGLRPHMHIAVHAQFN